MKTIFLTVLTFVAFHAFGDTLPSNPVRKATIHCPFEKTLGSDGKVENVKWPLSFQIDLDSKQAVTSCDSEDSCPLDGSQVNLDLTSNHKNDESLDNVIYKGPKSSISTGTNLSPINLDGGNGDDMEIFVRITLEVGDKSAPTVYAMMTYGEQGLNGVVTAPTICSIQYK